MSKSHNHNTNNSKPIEKNTLCRSFLGFNLRDKGYKINGLFMCRYGALCKEAHKWEDIVLKDHIRIWETKMDKSHISLYKLYRNIIDTITQSRDGIKNPKYAHQVHKLESMNLVEVLQFCYEIICFHRKIAKNLPSRKMFKGSETPDIGEGGYRYKEDVPQFYLDDEDIFWSLERTLHECPMHKNILMNPHSPHAIATICTGDVNCKLGEHNPTKIACCDDLLYGKCKCLSNEKITDEKKRIETELLQMKEQLNVVDSDGFQVKISKKMHQEISEKIIKLQQDFIKIPIRKIHYTEQGIVPMSVHMESIRVEKVKEVDISKLEITPMKKLTKKSYD